MGILLAGGAGDIGRHRVLALLDAARLVVGDGAAATHGIDAVVHVAGSIVVSKSVADLLGDNALIEACVLAGVKRFISSSTAAVYGAPASNPVAEDAPLRPISPCRSVRPVIEAVKTVSGVDFEVRHAPRRAGRSTRAGGEGRPHSRQPWLASPARRSRNIVAHALAWEKPLRSRRAAA